uniref:Lon proteolytic domain-containing protein n=1 Tax=Romanomermis culicivorax TaxID=13658 RepID=A0A915L1P0_ROMCU
MRRNPSFVRSDFLTPQQITGFWARDASCRREEPTTFYSSNLKGECGVEDEEEPYEDPAMFDPNLEYEKSIKKSPLRKVLEEDHYGVQEVKKRVLEYLAVNQLKKSLKGPILCFVGPPGVGKTSIGRSIARALCRKFHRVSLGGICDQSDIRGHRRTYIGAMPGRIINGLKVVQSRNPVFLLDEVDKMTSGRHGDPASALLEVLDPEQNYTFVDHYLNVPFDLSQVLFIATANDKNDIPVALLDRMEVIHIDGYTVDEKVKIGSKYLMTKQLNVHGLTERDVILPVEILKELATSSDKSGVNFTEDVLIEAQKICKYTYEPGVRNLERCLGSIMRFAALKLAEKLQNQPKSTLSIDQDLNVGTSTDDFVAINVDEKLLYEIFGPPTCANETRLKILTPGVAAGLCWTRYGGDLMYVESTKVEGDGRLKLTGQLGDVLQESVHIAMSWISCNSKLFNIQNLVVENTSVGLFDKYNIHIHFPSGAISKDGPSAGVTVVAALASLFTNVPMRNDTAMTGEMTLRGQVLQVGGVKEKVFAAYKNEFSRVILPKSNEKDTIKLSEEVQKNIRFIFVDRIEDVLDAAFERGIPKLNVFKGKLSYMNFNDKIILAPMVRVGVLPMRLLCLQYGADLVYCEEVIDYKMLKCERKLNHATNTIDYVSQDEEYPVFQTCSKEKGSIVFQMGTCDAERAMQVAKLVERDVAAIDVNMGCPKSFSLQGGMGAALLTKPEKIRQILTTLVNCVKIPVTCKIRVLPELKDTIELAKLIESCGVTAIAVHGRTKFERPQHENRNAFIAAIRDAVSIPVIANGGSKNIKNFHDIKKFRQLTGAHSVMIARAAMFNASVFKRDGVMLGVYDVIDDYLRLCCQYDANPAMVKYTLQLLLQYDLHTTERGLKLLEAKSLLEICKIFNMEQYYCEQINKQRDRLLRATREIQVELKDEIEHESMEDRIPDSVIVLPVPFIRNHYKDASLMPKMLLQEHSKFFGSKKPIFKTFGITELLFRSLVNKICSFSRFHLSGLKIKSMLSKRQPWLL